SLADAVIAHLSTLPVEVEAEPSGTDPREVAHIECDCIPNLGPSHCHLCGERAGHPISWAAAHRSQPVQVEVTDETGRLRSAIAEALELTQPGFGMTFPVVDRLRAVLTDALTPPVTEKEES